MAKDTQFTIRISSDLKQQAQAHASDTGRTLAGLIEYLLKQELKKHSADRQEGRKTMKLYHENELVGEITTNRDMTVEEACELLNIDLTETDSAGDPVWDIDAFRMEY